MLCYLNQKNLSKHSKFNTIAQYCYGENGKSAVKLIIIVNNIGLSVAYLIIFATVAQNMTSVFNPSCSSSSTTAPFWCSYKFLALGGALMVSPFIFARSLARLSIVSIVAVSATTTFCIITVGYTIYHLASGNPAQGTNLFPSFDQPFNALASITSVFLAYTFQFNFFPVYKSLQNPSDPRMRSATKLGLGIVLVIYLLVANSGYLIFGSETNNLLQEFTIDILGTPLYVALNIAFLFSATLTFPLMFFGAKNNIYETILRIRKQHFMEEKKLHPSEEGRPLIDKKDDHPEEFSQSGYVIYVLILYAFVVTIAIFLPGINVVFDFVGSTAANGLNFLLPSIFYLKLAPKRGKLVSIAKAMLITGIISGIVGLVSSIIQYA